MITLKDICVSYNAQTEHSLTIFDRLNATIAKGDFVIVLGHNGSGKSTFLKTISGECVIGGGSVHIDQVDVTSMDSTLRSGLVGRVFQDPLAGSAHLLTVRENLALGMLRGQRRALFRRGVKKEYEAIFRHRLSELKLGLEDRLDTPIGVLSGGQRQCISLVMATLQLPKVLLLDEHTAALDPVTADKVMDLTQKICEDYHLTTVCISHNLQHALRYGNRVIMIKGGKISLDLRGEEKASLLEGDLVKAFL